MQRRVMLSVLGFLNVPGQWERRALDTRTCYNTPLGIAS